MAESNLQALNLKIRVNHGRLNSMMQHARVVIRKAKKGDRQALTYRLGMQIAEKCVRVMVDGEPHNNIPKDLNLRMRVAGKP
jgi:hypothetical protein